MIKAQNSTIHIKKLAERLAFIIMLAVVPIPGALPQGSINTVGPLTMETVIISSDRSIYLPGEEILFTAIIAEADSYIISSLSKILRVEILNSSGSAIISEKYEPTEGLLTVKIKIPGNLPSGWYQVRAYTNWMRNSGGISQSSLNIRIINPSEAGSIIVYDSPDTISVSLIPQANGDLVAGIENSCAVRAIDNYGNPQPFTGALLNSKGDTAATVSTGVAGWGSVKLIPVAGESYRFIPQAADRTVTISQVPPSVVSGNIINLDTDEITVNVQFIQSGNRQDGKVRLLVHSLYSWYWYITGDTRNGQVIFPVPVNSLPAALVQFTILDDKGEILSSRLYSPRGIVSQEGIIRLDKRAASTGEELQASYLVDPTGTEGWYNINIRKKEPVETGEISLPGLPGWPADHTIPSGDDERNGWIIANRYNKSVAASFFADPAGEPVQREINFRELTSRREGSVDFLPETRGQTINGSVTRQGSGEPVGGEIMSLTAFSDNFLFTASTFESGRFHFSLPGRRLEDDLIMSYTRAPEPDWVVNIFPDFDTLNLRLPPPVLTVTRAELDYIGERSVESQLLAIYSELPADSVVTASRLSRGGNMFFGYPDNVVFVEEFIRLPNMREVIFEVVPSVVARKEDDRWTIRVVNDQPFPKIYHPLILLDGIPLLEFDQFLDLPPERIRKIEIINTLYVQGNVIFAGVVNFVSVNGDLAGLNLPDESKIISMQMPSVPLKIDVEAKPSPDQFIPDLSGTLRFIPMTRKGGGRVDFSAAGSPGEYIIIINGFTSTRQWASASATFNVTAPGPAR